MAWQNLMSWLRSLFDSSQLISPLNTVPYSVQLSSYLSILISLSGLFLLSACDQDQTKSGQMTQDLAVPERTAEVYVTDQISIAGQNLSLWFDGGRCQLQTQHPKLKIEPVWLKPTAPCYFMKSPGTDHVQVYQRDKTSRVLAVIGTPTEQKDKAQRCGQAVQGVVLDAAGTVRLSHTTRNDAVFCAGQGLDNLQYEIFAKD